jgi:hypothetical protein
MCIVAITFETLKELCPANINSGKCGKADGACTAKRCPIGIPVSPPPINRIPVGDEGKTVTALKDFGHVQTGMVGEVVADWKQHNQVAADCLMVEWERPVGGHDNLGYEPYRNVVTANCCAVPRHVIAWKLD